MSPAISFSGSTKAGPFWDQILKGRKTQTMREPRKHPIKPSDRLKLYWKQRVPKSKKPIHLIGETICLSTTRVKLVDMLQDEKNAQVDGFKNIEEFWDWFLGPEWHKCPDLVRGNFVKIINIGEEYDNAFVVPQGNDVEVYVELMEYVKKQEFDVIKWRYPLIG